MAEPKTKRTKESVAAFLARATDGERRKDCAAIARMMKATTRARGIMWGRSIAGFGLREITYADGHTAEWPVIAFAPRGQHLTVYISPRMDGLAGLRKRLGKHTLSGGCLHIKRLSDIDVAVLRQVIAGSVKRTTRKPR